ncbi:MULTISPECIES: peroxiredoxin [Chelativorans]|jgi:peroxiredoxin Q/BCP|uniref:thioredoxin-dependent peroxiredoxin n=1 Tax=Chelativorans sp. (strain BNC1) TaxID=266779 RepID=Q11HE4_CHESB|nr:MULTISPECIES: peroxiredoxin [Chelativorans]
MAIVEKGDIAPDFELPQDGGRTFRLSSLRGKPVVLYFYPKDDTSGCTAQAIEFSARKDEFEALGISIVGLSPDTVKSHDKFKAKHDISISLVADPEKKVVQDYGVWVEKSMYGRKYMGVERSTFLLDAEGRIAELWRKVQLKGHVDAVLKAAKALRDS